MPKLLGHKEIQEGLKGLDGWNPEGGFLVKDFEFKEFMDGIEFIGKVARVAEKLEHHPDINVRYTTVRLSIQTHSMGGITNWDLQLARAIDRLPSLGKK